VIQFLIIFLRIFIVARYRAVVIVTRVTCAPRSTRSKKTQFDSEQASYYIGDKVITGDHVARFYGACLGKMLTGGRSIDQIFSTREIFEAVHQYKHL
jgi:hypothetical protein